MNFQPLKKNAEKNQLLTTLILICVNTFIAWQVSILLSLMVWMLLLAPKAITATAHKLARMFYRMWTTTGLYTDPGMDYYERKYNEQVLNNLKKKAHTFGLELVPISQDPQNTSSSPTLAT